MFLIYINELAAILDCYGIKIKLFADDAKLYVQIVNELNVVQLQPAIDALVRWSTDWQLSISINKCSVLNTGRVTFSSCLNIDGIVLSTVKSARDLGVLVAHDVSPSLHISSIVARAHKRSLRAFNLRNIDLLLRAYLTYVRPLIEHDSIIWSPYTVKDIELIESVQHHFTKRLPDFNILPYAERLIVLTYLYL